VIDFIPESSEEVEYELDGAVHRRRLLLDMGHPVRRGDVLVRIDATHAELELRSAEARLKLAEDELAELKAWKRDEELEQLTATLRQRDAVVRHAEADLERAEQLRGDRAISQQEVDTAVRALETARAAKEEVEAALKLARSGPTAEQVAVAEAKVAMARAEVQLKQQTLDKCTVTCPLEQGTIVERFVSVGDYVTAQPSTPLMRVVDSRLLLAEVHVPERYQGLIRPHDLATIQAEGGRAGEREAAGIPAMVVLVNAQVDPGTRTFRVRVGVDNSRDLFKAGTFVRVRIPIQSADDAVVVPIDAVTFADGQPSAFVFHDGRVEKRALVLGISNRTHYQIVSGVAAGEQVVQGRLSLLADGLHVRCKDSDPGTDKIEG
jgi:HlyD family secretion protein